MAPNGRELSGPAKTPSHFRAELTGSAPASCSAAACSPALLLRAKTTLESAILEIRGDCLQIESERPIEAEIVLCEQLDGE